MTRSMKARRLFPCFIAVDEAPPLVIGDADLLQPKIRLLLKFAPTIDLVTDAPLAAGRDDDRPVRVIEGVPCRQAHDLIVGRPLVTLDTQDAALNMSLSAVARAAGVPVNVPDNTKLSSVYLGAIVDRSPVLIAISTGGAAPVLGQRLWARIENMLPAGFGRLATYLNRRRSDLRGLPPAPRRAIQHRLIDGPAAEHIVAGNEDAADRQLASLIAGAAEAMPGTVTYVDVGCGDPGLLSLRGVERIRNADLIVHEAGIAPEIIDLVRREAAITVVPPDLPEARADMIREHLLGAVDAGQLVVLLLAGTSSARDSSGMAMLRHDLAACGHDSALIPVAIPPAALSTAKSAAPDRAATTNADDAGSAGFVSDVPIHRGITCPPVQGGTTRHAGGWS